jgi:signal peptidase I
MMMEVDSAEIQYNYKKRRPWLAFLLSFFAPGLGQFYNGQLLRSAMCFFCFLPFLLLFIPFALFGFWGLVIIAIFGFSVQLIIAFDAAISASKKKLYLPKHYNRWYIYCVLIILIPFCQRQTSYALIKNIIFPFVRLFKINSDSMKPNILVSDRIVVDMTYDVSSEATRGDVVTFESPKSGETYIKRVIALPDERITIYKGTVYINGQPLNEPWELAFDPNVSLRAELYAKYAVGDEYIVSDGHVFLLGDNRDHSMDSRHWGAIDVNKIKGKVLYIFWSKDKSRIGKRLSD